MKLDYVLLREILEYVECNGDGQVRLTLSQNDFSESGILGGNFDKFAYHARILIDNEFIDGKVHAQGFGGNNVIFSVDYFGLKLQGHQLLESMQNEGVWEKIKSNAQSLGVEGLKKIPGLAIALLFRSL